MGVHLLMGHQLSGNSYERLSKISSSDWSSTDFPQPPYPEMVPQVVSSCNGLLCLVYPINVHVLWNPANDTFQKIPPSNLKRPCPVCIDYETMARFNCRKLPNQERLLALGFDAQSQDYKFLKLVISGYFIVEEDEDSDSDDDTYIEHGTESVQVEVYSVRHNSWKEVITTFPYPTRSSYPSCDLSTAVYVNGCCYMVCWDGNVASFDFSNDHHKFSVLPCPKNDDDCNMFLLELRGSLGAVIYPREGVPKLFRFWIYSASSSSWTRQISLDVRLFGAEMPLWFGKNGRNGECLLLRGVDGALLEYGYAARKLKRIDDDCKGKKRIYPYVETNHNLILTKMN